MLLFTIIIVQLLSICKAKLECGTGFIWYENPGSCLPKCISLDDTRNETTYECLYTGNYSIPLNKQCDYSYQCRSAYCECQNKSSTSCIFGQNGFIANNYGVCKSRDPCHEYPVIPNPNVTNDTTILWDYKTNKTKHKCIEPYTNDICTFKCIDDYIAVEGYFNIRCTLNMTFDKNVAKCEQCPDGFTNNNDFTKCVQKCLSNEDPRDNANEILCLWNNGNIPNGYHCTQYSHCKSGNCVNNKCSLSTNKEIIFEKDILYDGKFIFVYDDILNISECVDLCISHKYTTLCTHFSFNANLLQCNLGESRVYSTRIKTNNNQWISGFIREKQTFDIILKQDLSKNIYFKKNEILECNIDHDPSTVSKYSQLKYFITDSRYKSVQSMYEFILNIDGNEYHWIQNWDVLQNINQTQSMNAEKRFTWIAVNQSSFKTLDEFEGIYQTLDSNISLLNSIASDKYPIGWMQSISTSTITSTSNIWLAAKIQVIIDDSWELLLNHNLVDVDSSNSQYYFNKQTVKRINYDYKEDMTNNILFSALYKLNDNYNKDYLDSNSKYQFKLLYDNSIYKNDPIYWKQSSNPMKSNIINDFEPMQFLLSKFSPIKQKHSIFPTNFKGLKLMTDNISLFGTDNNNNNKTFRVGQFIDYLICDKLPTKGLNISNDTFMNIQPKGGIIGPVAEINYDPPRKSLETISLYIRNHRKCVDWSNNCWRYMIEGKCIGIWHIFVNIGCKKSCKQCNFVSRTDLYSFHLGSSTLPEIKTFIKYNKPFHRIPYMKNIWLKYSDNKDSGSNITVKYDKNGIDRTQMLFTFKSSDNIGWEDNIMVYWNVYESHSPYCTYHNDSYCLSINRNKCSKSFYDNTCLECNNNFIQYKSSQLLLNENDKIYGAIQCQNIKSDKIVVSFNNKPYKIFENEISQININRMSYYKTSPLGIGSIEIIYTIEHWQTNDNDFGINNIISGKLKWGNNDISARTIDILAIDDNLFELSELFWLKFLIINSTNNITLELDTILMQIVGPNNMYSYYGWIDIYDENMTLINDDKTIIYVNESNITLTFYLKLTNSTNYCEVYYQTKEDTAIGGYDFMSINQSLIWQKYDINYNENNSMKKIKIKIYDDNIWEIKYKIFYLSLYKSYGVSTPINKLKFVIIDNDSPNCNLTNWSNWTECKVIKGNQKIFRWKIDSIPDKLHHLNCENITQYKYCTNWNKLLKPGIVITPVQLIFEINNNNNASEYEYKKEFSLMLETAPNLTLDLGYNPYEIGENKIVAEININEPNYLLFYPKTVRFTVNSWYFPQSVFITFLKEKIDGIMNTKNVTYLFPQITIKSADSAYFELDENRKSILGRFMVKVIHNQHENVIINHANNNKNRSLFQKHKTVVIVISVLLFCVVSLFYVYRRKKRQYNDEIKREKKKHKQQSHNLYKEYDDDAILEDLLQTN